MLRTVLIASCLVFSLSCNKESTLAEPCHAVRDDFVIDISSLPNDADKQFFAKNYGRCKKRNLKKNENALLSVGVSVLYGLGTKQDPMKAFLWFKGAANFGNKKAHHALYQMFRDGVGVPKDAVIARKHYDAAHAS